MTKKIFLLFILSLFISACTPQSEEKKLQQTEEPYVLVPTELLGKWGYLYSINSQGKKFHSMKKYVTPTSLHYIKTDTAEYQQVQSNIRHQVSMNKLRGIAVFLSDEMESNNYKCYPVQFEKGDIMHWSTSGVKEFHMIVNNIKNDTLIYIDGYSSMSGQQEQHYYLKTK